MNPTITPDPKDPNLRTMLRHFDRFMVEAGYLKASTRRKDKPDPLAALLVDMRLFCTMRKISWRKVVDLARDQLTHDLEELAWMDEQHVNLRKASHLKWKPLLHKGMRI